MSLLYAIFTAETTTEHALPERRSILSNLTFVATAYTADQYHPRTTEAIHPIRFCLLALQMCRTPRASSLDEQAYALGASLASVMDMCKDPLKHQDHTPELAMRCLVQLQELEPITALPSYEQWRQQYNPSDAKFPNELYKVLGCLCGDDILKHNFRVKYVNDLRSDTSSATPRIHSPLPMTLSKSGSAFIP